MLGGVMSFFIIGMLLLVTRNLYNNSITHPPPILLPIPHIIIVKKYTAQPSLK
jgi:hypothetical protein